MLEIREGVRSIYDDRRLDVFAGLKVVGQEVASGVGGDPADGVGVFLDHQPSFNHLVGLCEPEDEMLTGIFRPDLSELESGIE